MRSEPAKRRARRPAMIAPVMLLAAAWGAASGEILDDPPPLSLSSIDSYASPFLVLQDAEGAYDLGPNVQRHLKAEIGMALASEATGETIHAESAYRNLQWVIANRLEADGGLNWNGPNNPYFFECHQHWLLIASELIARRTGQSAEVRDVQSRVWRYLRGHNPASADFYQHNQQHYGPFFGYRCVDRAGNFQTQAAFKGSYEIGVALWSLALHRDSAWLDGDSAGLGGQSPVAGRTVSGYLDAMVAQVRLPATSLGYVETVRPLWIRSLLWTGAGWSGWETHDWKYTLHMQEGALAYKILTGGSQFDRITRYEAQNLLASTLPSGAIPSIPDQFGDPGYEYGEALSALGLAAVAFYPTDRDFAMECLAAGQRVARYVAQIFVPLCTEDRALLLTGLCRVYLAQSSIANQEPARVADLGPSRTPIELQICPNPISGPTRLEYRVPPGAAGLVRIIDPTGRECRRIPVDADDAGAGSIEWDSANERGEPLASGHYSAVIDIEEDQRTFGFVILR